MNRITRSVASLLYLLQFIMILPNSNAQLLAGFEKINITPPVGGLMYGYAARGINVSTGINDSLFAKVLILDDGNSKLGIIALDMGAFYRKNTENVLDLIRDQLDLDNILFVASHSHSTPRIQDDFPNEANPWIRKTERRIAKAILDATDNMQPAKIGIGSGTVKEGFNRRVVKANGEVYMMWRNEQRLPTTPLDYELGVITIQGSSGPIVTLVNFACHPVVFGPDNLEFSADYPGTLANYVHKNFGGEVMFLPGAQGDINPFEDKQPITEGAFDQVIRLGHQIGMEVVHILKNMDTWNDQLTFKSKKELIPLANRKDVERDSIAFLAEINSILLGDKLALTFFPGEFFCRTWSLPKKNKVPLNIHYSLAIPMMHYFIFLRSKV